MKALNKYIFNIPICVKQHKIFGLKSLDWRPLMQEFILIPMKDYIST